MSSEKFTEITVQAIINSPLETVWKKWINPDDIVKWNFASDDWHCPIAVNDFKLNGSFNYRMEAKDGSFGFDFSGVYDKIIESEFIEYSLGDDRKVKILFENENDKTKITETFDAENSNSLDMQKTGWQTILNNFKKYAES